MRKTIEVKRNYIKILLEFVSILNIKPFRLIISSISNSKRFI